MEYKTVSITICDDCFNYDLLEETRIIHRRHCLYFCSSLMTTMFLVGIFYWTWIVLSDMEKMA